MLDNQGVAQAVLEVTSTLIESTDQLKNLSSSGEYLGFEQSATYMLQKLQDLISRHEEGIPLPAVESIADSLKRIMTHAKTGSHKTLQKIEFELLPLMKDFYISYYFYNCIFPEKTLMKKYYQQEMLTLGANEYLDEAVKTGRYKYDLSIGVLAYNKLEYTKLCIENILRYIPQNLNYELILINHGSTDGTKEFFESIAPTKQLDILINGGGLGAFTRIIEGKYYLEVSNDVIVTENAIANMLSCMNSDEKIAWVVPTTPNVSNLQTIPANYKTLDEMHAFAKKNNERSDPYRWEQRTRLCNPICLRRSSASFSSCGVNWSHYYYTDMQGGFNDDKEALLYRRNGYKMMLAKDSYCHHFGSVTLKDELAEQETFYDKGRKAFHDAFGIDPWGTGFCWSPELMSLLQCREEGHVNILGINCGIGSNPLKIKETLKERVHNLDVTLYNVTDDERYAEDLRGLSDVFAYEQHSCNFDTLFPGVLFNYIVFESGLETYQEPFTIINSLETRLTTGGFLILQPVDQSMRKTICENYPTATMAKNWCVIPINKNPKDSHCREDLMKDDGDGYRVHMTREQQIKTLLEWGEERFSQSDISTAIKIFESVLRLDKTNSQALNNLGVIQWQNGDAVSAIDTFQSALSFNPDDPDALSNLLQAATETGRFDLLEPNLLDTLKQAHPANPDIERLIDGHTVRKYS